LYEVTNALIAFISPSSPLCLGQLETGRKLHSLLLCLGVAVSHPADLAGVADDDFPQHAVEQGKIAVKESEVVV
jgi:hypothetical protein